MNQVDKTHHFLKNPKQLSAASGKGAADENKLFLFFQIRATHTSRPHGLVGEFMSIEKERCGRAIQCNRMAITNANRLFLLTQLASHSQLCLY